MASRILGRADCPECGFKSAHVKESEKCIYRYCPDCGSQHYAKTEAQRANLMKKTRLTEPTGNTPAIPTGSDGTGTAKPPSGTPTTAPAKRHGLGLFQ